MKKLLLASVCLLSTPALALPNPIGCYAWVATPEYAAKHSNEQIAALRLSVEKVTKEDREGWNWSFWLDVMLRGSTDVLGNHGGCDETRAPGALRCYLDYKFPGGGGGRVIFTPGRKPNIFITDPIRTDNNKLHL